MIFHLSFDHLLMGFFFGENVFKSLVLFFFNQILHFVIVALLGVPYVLGILAPYQRYELQIFPPYVYVDFFLLRRLCSLMHRNFIFWYSPDLFICFNYFFHGLSIGYCSQEIINSLACGYCLMFSSKGSIV